VEPAGNLTVRHNVNQGIRLIGTTNDISPAEIYFDKTVAGATHHAAVGYATNRGLFAWVNGGDRLNVLTNGNVGIGTTAPAFTLEVNGTAGKPGGGSWSVSSDRRLKKNVADLEGALETLLALRGVTFEYIDPAAAHELSGTRIGFIAQEVEEVLPDWVEESGGYKRLTVRGFEALAVEAFRTQEEKIETLSSESRQQRDEIASLRSRVTELESLQSEIDMLKTSLAALAAR